mmetsp:Transcript_32662/g.62991  ORF Transcript_32662/g.62991 Transcript_32662/m.62991 type:complete len:104 (+) Transcript_32662:130-441(+)
MYVHVKTGRQQSEHPSITKIKRKLRQRMVVAQRQLNQRLGQIAAFCLRLKAGQTRKLTALEKEKWVIIESIFRKKSVQIGRSGLSLNVDGSIRVEEATDTKST